MSFLILEKYIYRCFFERFADRPSLRCENEMPSLLQMIRHFLTEQLYGNYIFAILHIINLRNSLKQVIWCF